MSEFKGTKGEWLADVFNYPSEPKKIITGIKVKLAPNYYQRIFDTILPDSDKDYIKESEEIEANVKLVCAAPDLLKALIDIIKISDRDHAVWNNAKAVIKKATN